MSLHDVAEAIRERARNDPLGTFGAVLGGASFIRRTATEQATLCPRHNDHHESCRVNIEKGTFFCDPCNWGGDIYDLGGFLYGLNPRSPTDFSEIVNKLSSVLGIDNPDLLGRNGKGPRLKSRTPSGPLTLAQFSGAKRLPQELLERNHVRQSGNHLVFEYYDQTGQPMPRHHHRPGPLDRIDGRFWWSGEGQIGIYGEWNLADWRKLDLGDLLLVEGESDALTAWHYRLPCLGIPGSSLSGTLQALHLEGFHRVFLIKEADNRGGATFAQNVTAQLVKLNFAGKAFVIEMEQAGGGIKDLNDLHIRYADQPTDFRSVLDRLIEQARPATPAKKKGGPSSPWDKAQTIDEFLAAIESDAQFLVKNTLARRSVTVLVSPRGLGKTQLTYAWAIELARKGLRIMIIDRDNPQNDMKRRLAAWGAAGLGDKFKLIARDEAPPLTDKAAWAMFPYANYDLIVLDSISAATEGVDQGDGGKAGAGLAPLLDTARKGPAILLLANTDKTGEKIRDSGVLSDRTDVIFEARDATDLKLAAKHEVWWDALPPAGEQAWSDRPKRRRRRDSYCLALVPSKFRIGEWPDSLAFEIHHDTEPWSAIDVTREFEQELEQAKRDAADAEQAKLDHAADVLKQRLPLAKTTAAIDVLCDPNGPNLRRNEARRLIEDRMEREWVQVGAGTKTDPFFLESPARMPGSQTPSLPTIFDNPILAGTEPSGGENSGSQNPTLPRSSGISNSCRIGAEGRQESTFQTPTLPMSSDNENSCRLIPKEAPANLATNSTASNEGLDNPGNSPSRDPSEDEEERF
jgi:hypothetical protein